MKEPQRHRGTENEEGDPLTRKIIGAAIEVHRVLGPGLPEPLYEKALCLELDARGVKHARQVAVDARYEERLIGTYYVDLLVEDLVVVEIKSVSVVAPVHEAQLIAYMRPDQETPGAHPQLSFISSEGRHNAAGALKTQHRTTPRSGGRIGSAGRSCDALRP